MPKLYLNELSAVLAEKRGIDRRMAQRFVTSMVAVVQSGLKADRMVKIKGLGTFKIIDVDARESVNVNTGERLVIDSHSKLTFLPDNAMKELVNRPFSQFETVVLNDGVDFEDESEEDPAVTEETDVPVVEKEETPAAPVVEETPVVEQEDEPVFGQEEEPVVEQEDEPVFEQEDEPVKNKQFGWGHLAVTALTALLVGGGAGYFLGHGNNDSASVPSENQAPQMAQTVHEEEQALTTEQQVTKTETKTEIEPQVAEDTTTPIWEKYDAMDTRTRTGFYYITGLDRTEKAKAGDNSARIARRYFGAAELACYIEVFNGIDGRTVLEEGTEVKIPKIESKKAVRKRLEQQNNQQ